MAQLREFSYLSSDGVHTIHAQEWVPQVPLRGVVQIVHGVAEHMGRYEEVASFLTEHGYLVCGEDHLGHGKTAQPGEEGFFGETDGWALVTRDVARLRQLQGEKYPHLPNFLLGHSMGSFLARTYLIDYPGTLTGAILSGTGQESAPLVALGKLLAGVECRRLGPRGISPLVDKLSLGAYNRKFAPNRTGADWISRDEAQVDRYLADPYCQYQSTVSMFEAMMGGLQYIAKKENLARMDPATPVCFLSGDQDPVGGMGKGVKKVVGMFQKAGCRDVTVRLYPGGRHEMFHETNAQEVFEHLLSWLEEHCQNA